MSIQSEIDRLAQAKQTIAQAIEDKGVEVPEDATLDEFHSYIGAIQLSGGVPGKCLGLFNTVGGVIDALVTFGTGWFSGLVAVSDAFTCVAVGASGQSPTYAQWVSNVYSSTVQYPANGWLTFQPESGAHRMNWVICPDGSLSDQAFTLYGLR